MKILTQFSRVFVGILFIISGLIKLNDPVGFSFKLDEYFSEGVFNMPFLQPLSLSLAIVLVIVEVLLGVLLLLGYLKKFTLRLLLLMIVFFTFLTFYSAYFNKVTDCGCFGDAIKLTPWQSFSKDVVLLVLILILLAGQKYIKPLFSKTVNSILTFVALATCIFMGYHVLNHLPIVDFRPYKIGNNIKKEMEVPEGAPKSIYDIVFTYKIDGVEKQFKMEELGTLPANAEFVSRDEHLVQEGYVPKIHDFTMELEGQDYTPEVLAAPKALLIVAYDLQKASAEGLKTINKTVEKAQLAGYEVIGLTASDQAIIDDVKSKTGLDLDFYFCDGTTLKTIGRANPSYVILEYGTVTDKKHWNDVEDLNIK